MAFPELDPSLQETYTVDGYCFDLHDGDTVYYHASPGYHLWAVFQAGRLLGLNAPEIRPLKTRKKATVSKEALWGFIQQYALNRHEQIVTGIGYKLRIKSTPAKNKHFRADALAGKGKYGRWLVELFGADDDGMPVNINDLMLQQGFAVAAKY